MMKKRGDYIKRHQPPPPTSQVVFYNSKPPTQPQKQSNLDQTITPILQELLQWQKKVNHRLHSLSASPVVSTPAPAAEPVLPNNEHTATPTLIVRVKDARQAVIYSVPDRILGRNMGSLPAKTRVALYEPWTENDQGIWMRTVHGGWMQLWDRATQTFFAD